MFVKLAIIVLFSLLFPAVQGQISYTGQTTTHRYDKDSLTGNFGSCGYAWSDLNITSITAYSGNGNKNFCGQCVKVCPSADSSKCKNFLVVDTGGRPLDLSSLGVMEMFPGTTNENLGLYDIIAETVPSSNCAGIYKGQLPGGELPSTPDPTPDPTPDCSTFKFDVAAPEDESTTDKVYMKFNDSPAVYSFAIESSTDYSAFYQAVATNFTTFHAASKGPSICMDISNQTLATSSVARCIANETAFAANLSPKCVDSSVLLNDKSSVASYCAIIPGLSATDNLSKAINVFKTCLSNMTATAERYPTTAPELKKRDFLDGFISRVFRRI